MRIVTVDERHYTHTCPADLQPHVIDVVRTVVGCTDPQPCLTPHTVADGIGGTSTVDCHLYELPQRRCGNCRQVVVTRSITVTDLGHDDPDCHPAASGGIAPDPCTMCGKPLAAILADLGRHLGCTRLRRSRPAAAA